MYSHKNTLVSVMSCMLEKVSMDTVSATTIGTATDLDTTLVESAVPVESMSGKCVRYNYRLRVSNKMQRLLLDERNTKRWAQTPLIVVRACLYLRSLRVRDAKG